MPVEYTDYHFTDRLTTIYCVLTKQCNMRCEYCHVSKGNDSLSATSYIERLMLMLQERPKASIVFYGGEPLIQCSALRLIVNALSDFYDGELSDIEFSLNTNGTLITADLARFFREHSVYPIVSLDGMSETENHYRVFSNGTCAFNEIIRGMNVLKEQGVPFGVSAVLHDYNYKNMKEFLLWLKQNFSVTKVGVNLIHNNAQHFNSVGAFDDVAAIIDIIKYAYTIGVEIPQYMPRINNFRKGIPNPTYCASCSKSKTILYPDYTVGRCENYSSERFTFDHFRTLPALNLGFQDECRNCKALDICGGGCAPDMASGFLRERWCALSKGLFDIATKG